MSITRVSLGLLATLGVGALLLTTSSASAQRPLQQVLDLNRQGMESYNNLDIEAANDKLTQALQIANRGHVTGAPLARTYLNLGVVAVGGLQDNGGGLNYFIQALTADPTVQLDPLTSTPDIQTVFNLARARTGGGGGNGRNNPPPPPPPPPPHNNVAGNIPHSPIPEQAVETAVPVFLEVPADADVSHIYLYYKSQGMPNFRRVEMQHMQGGYGFEIPCTDVFQPSVAYYIEVIGQSGDSVGTAGTDTDPVIVPIVTQLSGPAPHLPGRPAPSACSSEECPPGMPGCHGGGGGHGNAGMGDTCTGNSDCSAGLRCSDNFCVVGDSETPGGGEEHHDEGNAADAPPRFFIEAGGGIGVAYVGDGQPADSTPQLYDPTMVDASGNFARILSEPLPGTGGHNDSLTGCDGSAYDDAGHPVGCGVRVNQPGFLLSGAIKAAIGYYITDRFALALTARIQTGFGSSTLAGLMFGLRAQYSVLQRHAKGIDIAPFLGVSVGQTQVIPDQGGDYRSWIASGLVSANVGIIVAYRFMKNFGLYLQPELDFFFPNFLFNIDITAGIQLAF